MSRRKRKNNKAVALKYNIGENSAPVVIASGYGEIANKIIEVAEKKGVPVYRDDSASSLLCMLEVGTTIPPELYQAVAVIYSEILKLSTQDKQEIKTKIEKRQTNI